MKQVDRYLFGPVAAVRPYLCMKAVLLLLAFDAWVVMAAHGGRYGVGEFNVAHFRWLDALQPVPSSALYVGLILFAGLLAFAVAVGGVQRIALGALAAVYTYGWMMSMLDSFQHHYLLSILLIALVGWPALSARDVLGQVERAPEERRRGKRKTARRARSSGPTASAWAYSLTCASVAVVYAYTAVSKTEEDWRMGHALQRIAPGKLSGFEAYFVGGWGMAPETFWVLVGHSVVLVQVVIAAGYLLAPLRDRGVRAIDALSWIAWVGATSFHLGAEYLELRIGWFSLYMLALASVCFLPASLLFAVGTVLSWPAQRAGEAWARLVSREGFGAAMPAALGAAGIAVLAGWLVDLPGALAAGVAAGLAVVVATAWLVRERRAVETLRWIAACAGGTLCMWLAIAASDVRFDYYRKVGGVMLRHERWEESLDAYVKANRYAPRGQDRRDKAEEVRQRLEMERARGGFR